LCQIYELFLFLLICLRLSYSSFNSSRYPCYEFHFSGCINNRPIGQYSLFTDVSFEFQFYLLEMFNRYKILCRYRRRLNVVVVWLAPLLYNRVVPGSNLGPETGYLRGDKTTAPRPSSAFWCLGSWGTKGVLQRLRVMKRDLKSSSSQRATDTRQLVM
jgi:hypothetical protein